MKNKHFSKRTQMIGGALALFIMLALPLAASLLIGGFFAAAFTLPLVSNIKAKGIKMDDTQEKFFTELEGAINSEMAKYLGNFLDQKSLTEKLDAFKKDLGHTLNDEQKKELDQMIDSVKNQATEIQKLKDNGVKMSAEEKLSLKSQLQKQIEESGDEFQQFKEGKLKAFTFRFDLKGLKAAANMTRPSHTPAGIGGPVSFEIDTQIVDIVRRRPFILDNANVSRTAAASYTYVEKYNPQGDAAFLAEGTLKPLIDFQYRRKTVDIKDIGDAIKVHTNMLNDIDGFMSEIENELMVLVDLKVDEKLLSGNSTTTPEEVDGVKTLSGNYTITAFNGLVESANDYDVIACVGAQIRNVNGNPTKVFISDTKLALMNLKKDAQGRYLLPPFSTPDGTKIAGIEVVPSNALAADEFVMGDMSMFMVKILEDFTVTVGWENDDLRKGFVTVVGNKRLSSHIKQNYQPWFVKGTFAAVKTLINKP